MKRIILRSLTILSVIVSLQANSQDVYWREGFEGGGISTTNPTGVGAPNNYYATSVNTGTGSWFLHNTYRTTGTSCLPTTTYGTNHLRILNVTIVTPADTAYVVAPVVSNGVSQIHFSRCEASGNTNRMSFWVRADTIADQNLFTGTGWTRIAIVQPSVNINVDTFVTVPAPFNLTTRRIAISSSQASNIDMDSVWLVSAIPIVTPVTFNGIRANYTNGIVKVLWSNETEVNTNNYEIERSSDGRTFDVIGSVTATNSRNYSWVDNTPITGAGYYRIRAVDRDLRITLSSVIRVTTSKGKTQLVVSPNPVENLTLNLQLSNFSQGTYTLKLYNAGGQAVFTSSIRNEGLSTSEFVRLPATVTPGIYTLQLTDGVTSEKKLVSVK